MWCVKAYELLTNFERGRDNLPPFEDDATRLILEEMTELNQFIEDAMNSTFHPVTNNFMAAVSVRQAALERNKRCLLTYQWNRLQIIRDMRWEFGSILPPEIKMNMNEKEVVWFSKYSKALANYMKSIGGNYGLNLIQDMKPPKHLYIEVKCLTDYGKIELDSGEVILLSKNSRHLIPTDHCESLIRQGILEQVE